VVKSDLPFKVSLKMAQALGNQHHNKKRQEIQVMRKVRYRLQNGKEHLAVNDQPKAQQRENLLEKQKRQTQHREVNSQKNSI
jgi:thermostable 8-oxoguanine DNA glycosylase